MNRQDYSNVRGERYEARRPKDSDVLKGEGTFDVESVNRSEYKMKAGERYDAKRPHSSGIFKVRKSAISSRIPMARLDVWKDGKSHRHA